MNSLRRFLLLVFITIALCALLISAATEFGISSTTTDTPANVEAINSTTPAPGGTEAGVSTSIGSTSESAAPTESPEVATFTMQPQLVQPQRDCLCDLTPDFCDIGCCCDTVDCGVTNLSTVFTGCQQKARPEVCIEKWLIFRGNVESSLLSVTDSLFCVQTQDKAAPSVQDGLAPSASLGDSYHFSPPTPPSISHTRPFYRVDDVIQTFMVSSRVRGLLRQPAPGAAASFCMDRNPARFLRSLSQSCSRIMTPQACTTDPAFSASTYFSDLYLLKIPIDGSKQVSDSLIPVTPLSEWPEPVQQNNSCVNAVKSVEFIIGYTGRGELTFANVNVALADVDSTGLLLQTHSVKFQMDTSRSTPEPDLAFGLRVGSPIIGRIGGKVEALTTLGLSPGGTCSSERGGRVSISFTHNSITGCTISYPSSNCSELRSQVYGILQGPGVPEEISMNFGSQPYWTRVIVQECPVSPQETWDFGCILPKSLSIQVLWARQGLVDLPQNYILGAKYIFKCETFKSALSSRLILTTHVTFTDTTVYPISPRGSPKPDWKFPFSFFLRGMDELDGHTVSSGTEKFAGSLMLLTVMLLTGWEIMTSFCLHL
uniref:Tectonic family member 3 n=1 Tax=Cynoglossus semilaevis TaxID=244447 RepID=A0A3P8VGK2_CYNSE